MREPNNSDISLDFIENLKVFTCSDNYVVKIYHEVIYHWAMTVLYSIRQCI